MTNEQILKKAIKKAVKNGFEDRYSELTDYEFDLLMGLNGFEDKERPLYFRAIFSHDFAKTFWGNADFESIHGEMACYKVWQFHLQLMVLEKDPIKYLEQFL